LLWVLHTFYFSVLQVTERYVAVPSVCRSSVWNVGGGTILAPGIFRWILDLWEIFPPVLWTVHRVVSCRKVQVLL
jgi:hypothetical protein